MVSNDVISGIKVRRERSNAWWHVLLVGLGLFLLGIVVLGVSGNPILFPTVVMVGSFTVPTAFVVFFYERRHWSSLKISTTALSFLYGGILGVFASSLLEPIFVGSLNPITSFLVGLIEEFAKVLGILVIARHLSHDSEIDGLILGAAAGMGFAALESTGYSFTTFLATGGSFSTVVFVTLMRGLLSPLGHGTWTAILAGVLFRETRAMRFHINLKVIVAYLGVAALHGLWDGLPIVIGIFSSSNFYLFLSQAVVGAIGIFFLWRRWREARRLQVEALDNAVSDNAVSLDETQPVPVNHPVPIQEIEI